MNSRIAPNEESSEQRLMRFDGDWRTGSPPQIREYLIDGPDRESHLLELIRIDIEYRWRRFEAAHSIPSGIDSQLTTDSEPSSQSYRPHEAGLPKFPIAEDYASSFGKAEFNDSNELVTLLVLDEYRVRTRWGDRPTHELYFDRFPYLAEKLSEMLRQIDKEIVQEGEPDAREGHSTREFDFSGPTDSTVNSSKLEADQSVPRYVGRYRLEKLIGRGGFGQVWSAFDTELERRVAVKIQRPDLSFSGELIAGFLEEARKMAQFQEFEGVVTVYDSGKSEDFAYIVSELIEGGNLEAWLDDHTPEARQSVELVSAIAEALHRAHLHGFVHRDIKPSNILLRSDLKPVLADFGLAVSETEGLTHDMCTVGTPAYMSPEQFRGNSHLVTAQSDVYSLGVVFYRLLTGRLPFVATNISGYKVQILNRPPRPLRTIDDKIPAELQRICLRCLEKSPSDRYPTAADLQHDLERWHREQEKRPLAYLPVFLITGAALLFLAFLGLRGLFGGNSKDSPNQVLSSPPENPISQVSPPDPESQGPELPQEVLFPGRTENNGSWYVDEKQRLKPLIVSSQQLRLIHMGSLNDADGSGNLSVELQRTDKDGMVGVFMGYREDVLDGQRCAQFQLIHLASVVVKKKAKLFVSRSKTCVHPQSGKLTPRYAVKTDLFDFDDEFCKLEIQLKEGRIHRLKLGGKNLGMLASDKVNQRFNEEDYVGPWGVYNELGTTWFLNAMWTTTP